MKRAADDQKERQEMIREQKKQGSNMSSYVERVIDFLEKLMKNQHVPKALQEDIEWAIKTINSNRLYKGQLENFKFVNDRVEIKAWMDMIKLSFNLINNSTYNNKVSEFPKEANNSKDDPFKMSHSGSNFIKNAENKEENIKRKNVHSHRIKETQDEIDEFFEIIGETDTSLYDGILEKIDETQFDSFTFVQAIEGRSFQYLMYKFFKIYEIINPFHLSLKKLSNFSGTIQKGYFVDNPYHNPIHIVDSMQAMHYLFHTANIRKFLKKSDILASFLANLIHDYEHPGYTNQFVVRTKHPLALRYNDMGVLENYHLAAGFTVLVQEDNNFLDLLSVRSLYELRKIVIKVVLDSDLSQHFHLLTELKTKLDRNFPSEVQDDINLVISLSLK